MLTFCSLFTFKFFHIRSNTMAIIYFVSCCKKFFIYQQGSSDLVIWHFIRHMSTLQMSIAPLPTQETLQVCFKLNSMFTRY